MAIALFGTPLADLFHRRSRGSGALRDPPAPNDQPVLVVAGLFIDGGRLAKLTHDYLDLKHRFYPNLNYPSTRRLDRVLPEIKGAELRKHATRGNARQKLHAVGFLDRIMGLLRRHRVSVVARVWIKVPGSPFEGTAVYTSSIQGLCTYFEHYLKECDDSGLCIADSRSKSKNLRVSHSTFTQKFSAVPNYERLVELPTFGHSDNHVGLQVCDIVGMVDGPGGMACLAGIERVSGRGLAVAAADLVRLERIGDEVAGDCERNGRRRRRRSCGAVRADR